MLPCFPKKSSRVGEYVFAGHWAGVSSDDFGISIEWGCRYYVANWEGKLNRACLGRKEGKVGGKSALGFLEHSGLEARISALGEAFWAGCESDSDSLSEKYSWPEPRLGKRT